MESSGFVQRSRGGGRGRPGRVDGRIASWGSTTTDQLAERVEMADSE